MYKLITFCNFEYTLTTGTGFTEQTSTMKKSPIFVSQLETIRIFGQIEKPTMTNIVLETPLRMNKKGNPYFGKVMKRSSCNYLVGMVYENRVNNNELKEGLEGDFKTESLKGKKHVNQVVLIDKETESTHYVMVERFFEIKPQVTYTFEGNSIEKVMFQDFMIKYQENHKQQQDRKVMVMTPKVENIKEFTLNGNYYVVVD